MIKGVRALTITTTTTTKVDNMKKQKGNIIMEMKTKEESTGDHRNKKTVTAMNSAFEDPLVDWIQPSKV